MAMQACGASWSCVDRSASCGKTRGPVSLVLHVRGVWMGGQGVQAVSLPVIASV